MGSRISLTRCKFLVAAGTGALLAAGASAQPADEGDVPTEVQTPATAGSAAEAADTEQGIGDIVVVATRRESNLQDTPIAISAFSEETLEKSRIDNIQDLDVTTTGLSISTNGGLGQTIYLRGVGSSDASPGQEGPVAIYIDNVYQPTMMTNDIPFANVERVEVLKGPQGTLFGRNATGGLIHIITKEPTQEVSGSLSGSYGNYDQVTLKAYVAGGLSEALRADLAVYYLDRGEGWGRNIFLNKDIYKDNMAAFRSKVVVEPADAVKITVIGNYSKQKTTSNYQYRLLPGTIPLTLPAGTPGFISGVPFGTTPGFYDVNNDILANATMEIWGVSGRAEFDMGFATLSGLASYQDVTISPNHQSPDATPNNIVTAAFLDAINDTFQAEVQLASNSKGPFRWIAGLYYMDMRGGSGPPGGIKLSGFGLPVPFGTSLNIVGLIDSKSYAAFAEIEYDITESTTLTIGGRYTVDKRHFFGSTEVDLDPFGYNPVPGTFTPFGDAPGNRSTYKEPSYRAILSQDLNDDVMLYASYSHGFKSGNYNTVNPANPPYNPEKLDAYEVGIKSRFLDDKLQFNAAAFYYSYSGLQLQINVGATIITINAADAKVKGFETELTAKPINNLRISAGYSYLDAKYGAFPGAECYFPNPNPPFGNIGGNCLTTFGVDVKGNRLIRTPKHQANATIDYTIPSSVGDFNIVATYFYNSGYPYTTSGRLFEDDYDLINGSIRWTEPSERVSLTAFVKNLTKTKYSSFKTEQGLNDIQAVAPPRTYGLELGYKF